MAKSCICAHCESHHEPEKARKPASKLRKGKDNPFASRGRDEFSDLVAKTEERKQRILKRSGIDNAMMVRFVDSSGNKLKPVIIRAKSDMGQTNKTKGIISSEEFKAEETTQKEKNTVQGVKLKNDYHYGAILVIIISLFLLICLKILWNNPGNMASTMA